MTRKLRFASQSGSDDRRVSWLELFFDLVYVAAFGEMALRLNHTDFPSGLSFAALFTAAWLSWFSNTLFAARYGNDSRAYTWATLLQMLALGALAAGAAGQLSGYAPMLALGYAVGRGALAGLYLWQARQEKKAGHSDGLAARVGAAQLFSAAVWLASAFVPGEARWWLWGVALAADLLFALFGHRQHQALPHEAHLPERLGQLYIITLGVAVTEIVKGAAQQPFSWAAQLPPALSLVALIALWQIYFDSSSSSPVKAAQEQGKHALLTAWQYLHLPLMAALTALGAGLGHTAAEQAQGGLVGVSLAVLLLCLALLRFLASRYFERRHVLKALDLMTLYLLLAAVIGGAWAYFGMHSRLSLSLLVALTCLGAPLVAQLDPHSKRVNDQLERESEDSSDSSS